MAIATSLGFACQQVLNLYANGGHTIEYGADTASAKVL
jgi:hypothetical protein